MAKKNAVFLFGAGAERDFGLPTGEAFLQKTLPQTKEEFHESILKSLQRYFKNEQVQKKYTNWLTNYRRDIVTNEEIQTRVAKHNNTFGILERLFHTIINPYRYGENRFWKVFNFYWFAYFAVFEPLLQKCIQLEAVRVPSVEDENIYGSILHNLELCTRAVYEAPWSKILVDHFYYAEQYYKVNEVYAVRGILTTNYTPLVKITGVSECQIAFLNGRLSQFEYPYELIIKDLTTHKRDEGDFYFPFIMAQSALKPIIHPEQISAYSKAVKILGKSDLLIIIGYNINEDDNHINAMIIDFIRRRVENKVLFCHYIENPQTYDQTACQNEIFAKLRLPVSSKQLAVVRNESNSVKLFAEVVKNLSLHGR